MSMRLFMVVDGSKILRFVQDTLVKVVKADVLEIQVGYTVVDN